MNRRNSVIVLVLILSASSVSYIFLSGILTQPDRINLDIRFDLTSSPAHNQFIAWYNWSANTIEHDIYGTHINWINSYPQRTVLSEGEFTEAFIEHGGVYIQWNDIHFFGNQSWSLELDLYLHGLSIEIRIDGNKSGIHNIYSIFTESGFGFIEPSLEDMKVQNVSIVADIIFSADAVLWGEASQWTYGISYEYADLTIIRYNQEIVIISVE